jgi:site-specific DNA recombinase
MNQEQTASRSPAEKPRAALYARVSSDQQAQAGTIESQVQALKDRIAQDGYQLESEFCFQDDGYTGATLVRPALEQLRDAAYHGGIDRLYVHSPDRLARKYAWQVLLLDEFQRAGVEVIFLNHEMGKSPEGDLLLQMQGMIAEYERAKILERSRRGKRHAARRGDVSVLSGAPYGYRYLSKRETGGQAQYQVVLEEARVVKQIFQWVGREGESLRDVARRLKAEGVKTRTGKDWWDPTTLAGMLKNPASANPRCGLTVDRVKRLAETIRFTPLNRKTRNRSKCRD